MAVRLSSLHSVIDLHDTLTTVQSKDIVAPNTSLYQRYCITFTHTRSSQYPECQEKHGYVQRRLSSRLLSFGETKDPPRWAASDSDIPGTCFVLSICSRIDDTRGSNKTIYYPTMWK